MQYSSNRNEPSQGNLYEKSLLVLWAPSPNGIVLHNFLSNTFIELRGAEEAIWARLDGLDTEADIAAAISRQFNIDLEPSLQLVRTMVEKLARSKFLQRRG